MLYLANLVIWLVLMLLVWCANGLVAVVFGLFLCSFVLMWFFACGVTSFVLFATGIVYFVMLFT